jgi:hypothetical protein
MVYQNEHTDMRSFALKIRSLILYNSAIIARAPRDKKHYTMVKLLSSRFLLTAEIDALFLGPIRHQRHDGLPSERVTLLRPTQMQADSRHCHL